MVTFAPVVMLHSILNSDIRVAAGFHLEEYTFSENHLAPEEIQIIRDLSPRKKTEWLASRELLYQVTGWSVRPQCLYDDFGKPVLKDSPLHISVSHSDRWCAAMMSARPCGVDVQIYSDTLYRIAARFLTAEELKAVERTKNKHHYLHFLWGAKECIYKAYGRRRIGFRENIFIYDIDLSANTARGEIRYEGLLLSYDIFFRMLPEVAWVFCLEHAPPHLPPG